MSELSNIYITEISSAKYADALYKAAGEVFAIPPIDILNDAEAVKAWRQEEWKYDDYFSGPEVYYGVSGRFVLIITETSARHIRAELDDDGSPAEVTITFPHGSVVAATDVLHALLQLLPEEELEAQGPGRVSVVVAHDDDCSIMTPGEAYRLLAHEAE